MKIKNKSRNFNFLYHRGFVTEGYIFFEFEIWGWGGGYILNFYGDFCYKLLMNPFFYSYILFF